jgi:hypothetical protein
MNFLSREETFTKCEEMGEAAVKAWIDAGDAWRGGEESAAREWLYLKDINSRESRERLQLQHSERAVLAAENSAKFSMWSAIISLSTVLVTVVIFLYSI